MASDGRDRPAAHRRRAAGAARVPAARVDARAAWTGSRTSRSPRTPTCSSATPRAGRRRHHARERVDRLAPARPLLPDHPARLAAAGAARPRGDRRASRGAADQGERGRAARLHRGGGDPVRRVRPLDRATRCASSSSCRSTATTRGSQDQVLTGEEIRAIIDARAPARGAAARAARHRARVPLRRRRAARSASSTRCPSRSARDCNRIRLTADGKLRTCLFSMHETDLREPLRAGRLATPSSSRSSATPSGARS